MPPKGAHSFYIAGLTSQEARERKVKRVCLLCEGQHMLSSCPQRQKQFEHGQFFYYKKN
jgi:hypothetical protein